MRKVVRSLKERLRNKFNVSVAEIDYQDLWQRAMIAAVTVSPDQKYAESVLQSVESEAATLVGPMLVSSNGVDLTYGPPSNAAAKLSGSNWKS